MDAGLRATTWLAPGLPVALFETACAAIAGALGTTVTLRCETSASGPPADLPDPFGQGECDVGFLCLPSYRRLAALVPPPIRLVPAAPVPGDARCEGRPVYFAELVAGPSCRASSLAELDGARVAGNDAESLSGHVALTEALARCDPPVRVNRLLTGSHHASLDALARGDVDAAVVDSNTRLAVGLPDGCRLLEAWGPYPVQPVVVGAHLDPNADSAIATALLALGPDDLAGTGFVGFAPPECS